MAKDHRTSGLAPAAAIAAVSVGVLLAAWRICPPAHRGYVWLVHGSAAMSLVWSLAAWLLTRSAGHRPEPAPSSPAAPNGPNDGAPTADWIAVLRIAALSLGLLAVIPMLYKAVLETLLRMLYSLFAVFAPPTLHAHIWPTGIWALSAVGAAAVLGAVQTGDRRLITSLFWLVVFAGLWSALRLPAFLPVEGSFVQHATRWSVLFMIWSAVALGAFTLAGGYLNRRRRATAWPSDLWKLTSPSPPWPGFRYSAGVVAVAVLILGCVHITVSWTAVAAFIAGASMLTLAGRKWEENLADVGLALVTLGVVSLVTLWRPEPRSQSDYFAEIINRALIGLAAMTAFWHWLADVWVQQLDDGQAWTTAGRLIRVNRRVGYLVGATALLVSMNLAVWPMLPYAGSDDAPWRWVWGNVANLLLVLALLFSTLRTGKPTLGWLCLLAVASSMTFAMTRVRGSDFSLWWADHWPLVLTAAAATSLLLAAGARRTRRWLPFWEPLYLSGLLILPLLAIMGVSFVEQLLLPRWVPSATFGGLAGVYLLAAWLPGPRGFIAVAVLCAAVSIYLRV